MAQCLRLQCRRLAVMPLVLLLVTAACSAAGGQGVHDDTEVPPLHFPTGPTLGQLRVQPAGASGAPPSLPRAGLNGTASAAPAATTASTTPIASTASGTGSPPPSSSVTPLLPNITASVSTTDTTTTVTAAATASGTVTTKATTAAAAATLQPFLEPTKSAAVLVGVFVTLALLGYMGLMVWRRVLERRYGNREILINEEPFEQERDLGNFQL